MKHLKKLYDWVLHWAKTPYGELALFIIAFCESSFFPIPPDVLLMALALSVPTRAFRFALVCTLGSALGGVFGYYIGLSLFDHIGQPILHFYGAMEKYDWLKEVYQKYDAAAVAIAGFTPVPYKVFTIAAGACQINFQVFVLSSIVSRGLRFVIIAALLYFYGEKIKAWIDRYFNVVSIAFVLLLIGGFVLLKVVLH